MKTLRQQGRAFALQLLYQTEVGQTAGETQQERFWENSKASKKARAFAAGLVEQTLAHRQEIDRALTAALDNWKLERLSVIVRNVLRLSACELLVLAMEPPAVVINEALELTRSFTDEESTKIVNGVLEKLQRMKDSEAPSASFGSLPNKTPPAASEGG